MINSKYSYYCNSYYSYYIEISEKIRQKLTSGLFKNVIY